MHVGNYQIAGVTVQIDSLYTQVHRMCREYACGEDLQPEIAVCIQPEDIANEQAKSRREALAEGKTPIDYEEAYLETLAVYRKIADAMLERSILLFHGSAIAVGNRAVLFTAKSGTGKSTHTRLWREMLADGCVMVNDDKPLLRIGVDHTEVCGTPWNGKHHLGVNCIVPLEAICVLERGERNEIMPLELKDVLPMLMQQSYRPEDRRKMLQVLQLLEKMAANVRFYRLRCNMDPEAAAVSYGAIFGTENS